MITWIDISVNGFKDALKIDERSEALGKWLHKLSQVEGVCKITKITLGT